MTRSIIYAALALAVAGGIYWSTSAPAPSQDEAFALPYGAANAQEADAAEIDTSSVVEMALGPEDAAVTVIEYASFTCPHCATFHGDQYKQLKSEYIDTGKIRFIYRDVYFDRFGLWASMVARCGGEEKFFGMASMIYEQQREWIGNGQDPAAIAERLRKIGKIAGLEEAQLEACLSDDARARTLVAWYRENAEEHDITSTPALVIDGETYGNMSFAEIAEIIDGKLGE
jgi:protein-disulfide isomerase